MNEHLKNLIFGLGGYEKVKIDTRFDEIITILPQIRIKELTDFEIIEKCIYKLKENLRIKSSNLNRLIKDSSSTLNKKKVQLVIDTLENLKLSFIKTAFSFLESPHENNHYNQNNSNEIEKEETPLNKSENIPKDEIKKEEKENLKNKDINSLKVYSDKDVEIYLCNGKITYLLIDFKTNINLALLKYLGSLVFEEMNAHGTNIIIQKNKALIIPRFQEDNLINLPRIESNLDEVFLKIKSSNKEKNKEEKYLELSEEKEHIKTKKKEEDSLDALLSGIEEKKVNLNPEPNPKHDKENIEVEKETEKIKEEKKEENFNVIDSKSYEVYRDENIVAYLNEKSQVLGEIVVKNLNSKKNSELNESELSYISIFSKVFATVLFEVLGAQGTNILWNFKDDCFKIVPRFQEDNLKINWEPKQSSDEFLEQIKNKLINEMKKEVEDLNSETEVKNQENKEKIKTNNENSNNNVNERAKHILDSLKRMP